MVLAFRTVRRSNSIPARSDLSTALVDTETQIGSIMWLGELTRENLLQFFLLPSPPCRRDTLFSHRRSDPGRYRGRADYQDCNHPHRIADVRRNLVWDRWTLREARRAILWGGGSDGPSQRDDNRYRLGATKR